MSLGDMEEQTNNPVDVVERLAAVHEWSFARASDDEVTLVVAGRWTDYQVSLCTNGHSLEPATTK